MTPEELKKRLVNNNALFKNIHVIEHNFDILPENKKHFGAYIEYQDLYECRQELLDELIDTVVDWVYSNDKYKELVKTVMELKEKSESSAAQEIARRAHNKFRESTKKLVIQGQLGELFLFHFIQKCFKAVPLLRKMSITTSSRHERFGADAIHYNFEKDKNIIYLGEAKTYTSEYSFANAFETALNSILDTYKKHRKELDLYIYEDFLDEEMQKIALNYKTNNMENVEVRLVNIILYNETKKIDQTNEKNIKNQIEQVIKKRYADFDNSKIDIPKNPILRRITYIIFPIWDLENLAGEFANLI